MRSMIEQYALEEKTKVVEHDDGTKSGGEPSGKFWMNKEDALSASKEVLNTHKGLAGAALDQYIATFFDKAWGHFDVNKGGWRSSRCHSSPDSSLPTSGCPSKSQAEHQVVK